MLNRCAASFKQAHGLLRIYLEAGGRVSSEGYDKVIKGANALLLQQKEFKQQAEELKLQIASLIARREEAEAGAQRVLTLFKHAQTAQSAH